MEGRDNIFDDYTGPNPGETSREHRVARAIEEDSQGLAASLLHGITGQQMVDLVWTLANQQEEAGAHQSDPCYIAAVVAQAVMLLGPNHSRLVQQFQTALRDALVNNPGFVN